jgi:hypothetical protein
MTAAEAPGLRGHHEGGEFSPLKVRTVDEAKTLQWPPPDGSRAVLKTVLPS